MCRHLAYVGPTRSLASLVLESPHSLLVQASAPRLQRHGRVNADGYGVAWWPAGAAPDGGPAQGPVRHRRAQPIWTDRSFASWAPTVTTTAAVAAVRNATPPFPVDECCTAPFVADGWAFSHNGSVDGYAGEAGQELRALLTPSQLSWVEAPVDSAFVFALVRAALSAGAAPDAALLHAITSITAITPARLTLLLSDGRQLVGCSYGDTLYSRCTPEEAWLASEPLDDDPAWQIVPEASVVTVRPGVLSGTPL